MSFSGLLVNAQTEKRSVFVKKIDQEILLDGILDEAVWDLADSASDFWQLFPTDSLKAQDITEVKLLYNDTHIYIGATAKSSVGGD
ncbi:MAG: hydrolase, partial [Flavobacteriaceae bacterium]